MKYTLYLTLFLLLFILNGASRERSSLLFKEIGGGASNHNFIIRTKNTSYFMRLACQGRETLNNEYQSTKIAAKYGLAPEVVSYRPKQSIMISEFIANRSTINLHLPKTLERATQTIRELHAIDEAFPFGTNPFDAVKSYSQQLKDTPAFFKEKILPFLKKMEQSTQLYPFVPCHLDLHNGNFIDNGQSLQLIDFEYAAMSDPFFDLATLASTESFTDKEMLLLLEMYTKTSSIEHWNHFYKMRILADARWALWSFLQAESSTIDHPFLEEGYTFMNECLNRIAKQHIEIN